MYIGNDLQIAHPSYKIIDDISSGFNGSATSFALQVSGETPVPFPISTQQVMISVNGVVQEPDPNGSAGFKLLGSNIVFSSAPANGHAFFGVINAGADYVTAGSEFPDGSATAPSFTFQDDQDTGWFRNASGDVGYSSNGSAILNFDGNGLTIAAGKGLTVDTSTLKVDATNNRVGIGSASPTETLHVYQNAADNVNALFEQGTTNSGNLIQFKQTTTGSVARTAYIGHGGDNTGQLMIQNSHNIYLQTGGSNTALTIDSSQNATFAGSVTSASLTVDTNTLHVDATNNRVGINNASPGTDLDVIGTARANNFVLRTNGSAPTADASIFRAADNTLAFATSNTERARFNSSGNLFLGATSGEGKLFISGPTTDEGDAKGQIYLCDTAAYDASPVSGIVFKGIHTGTSQAAFSSVYGGKENATDANYSGYLAFSTRTHGSLAAERMRIDSSGRVFIGTTTEGESGSDDLNIATSGNTGITVRSGTSSNGNLFFSDGTSGVHEYRGYVQYKHSNNTLVLGSNSADALTIDSSQNATFAGNITTSSGALGIGDTTPNYEIHVKGADASPQLRLESSDGTGSKRADLFLDGAKAIFGANQSAQSIAFQTGYTDRLTIANDGSVTAAGTVSDSKGNLRSIPRNNQTSAYTLVAADAGKFISTNNNVTVNSGLFSIGDAITIWDRGSSDITITQGSSVTIYNSADATTGNRTLAAKGLCTLLCVASNEFVISGAGLS